ncbi:uncharacterized protein ARMOST_15911 [Armillaria ostoyae]|uniref:Protein kinase domain-containing protein n=1 Tax=Armillaria ostoyae TaxID=47428 RepID=A0A284RUN0_ARMOS|nr:uncharacterized protein ARMOST_15911 [Armillaria ostoyae]
MLVKVSALVVHCELVKPDIDLRADEQSRRFEVQVISFPWMSRPCARHARLRVVNHGLRWVSVQISGDKLYLPGSTLHLQAQAQAQNYKLSNLSQPHVGGLGLVWKDGKTGSYDTELAAYRLLYHLQDRYIRRLFGVARLRITLEPTLLHPVTDIPEQEATRISSYVMTGLRAIGSENCLLHDIHTRNVVLREGNRSPTIIDFGEANIRQPGTSDED